MKKAIVLLLALAVLGGAAFAEDGVLALSGYVSTGVEFSSADAFRLVNSNGSGTITRMRLNGSYTMGDAGMWFRTNSTLAADGTTGFVLGQALVWADFLDDMVTVKVGKLNDYSMSTYWNYYGNTDGKTGVQVFLKPADGLVASAYLRAPTTAETFATALEATQLAVSYAIPDVATILAGGKFLATTMNAYVQFDVSAVENLGLTAEVYIPDFGTIAPELELDVSYGLDALTVGLHSGDVFASDLYWSVNPYVDYSLSDTLTVGADVSYDSDAALGVGGYFKAALNKKATFLAEVAYSSAATVINLSFDHNF